MKKPKSVVTYTLSHCVKCMKCIQACPMSALRMEDSRIHVNHERCINCAKCISACHSKGLLAQGSTIEDIQNYDYAVCMVPPALVSTCETPEKAEELFAAIKALGFDEVVDTSDIYGQVMKETTHLADEFAKTTVISSFCPVVNRLIETKYPMLLENLAPVNYPSEASAISLRKQFADKGNVGIFNLAECEAKLELAKYPYGNMQYETDHALAIVDVFPLIRQNMNGERIPESFCLEGLQSCTPAMMVAKPEYLLADGLDKVTNILDMAEFDMLNDFQLLYLFPCFNGCTGGHLLFGNSYAYRNNVYPLTKDKTKPLAKLEFEELYSDRVNITSEDKRTFQEKMQFFQKVNEQLEKLPGYDCSACGMQTCRIMAEEIVNGNKTLKDCHILTAQRGDTE